MSFMTTAEPVGRPNPPLRRSKPSVCAPQTPAKPNISSGAESYVSFLPTLKPAGRPKPPLPPSKPSVCAPPTSAKSVTAAAVLRSADDDSAVRGMTVLDNRLYVLHIRSNDPLDELDAHDLRLQRRLLVPGEPRHHLADMAACQRRRRLFISHSTLNCVYVLALSLGDVWTTWKTDGSPWGLSVTLESGNLLVTLRYADRVDEYSPAGQRLRRVELQRSGVFSPWHAVQLSNLPNEPELLVVGHGDRDDDAVRVGFVRVLDGGASSVGDRWYGGPPGSGECLLSRPQHLAIGRNGTVAVADVFNDRVVLLDDELRRAGVLEASTHDRAAGWWTSRVCWIGWHLYVAEVKVTGGKFTASRLTVYEIR